MEKHCKLDTINKHSNFQLSIKEVELFNEFIMFKTNLQQNRKVKYFNIFNDKWTYAFKTKDIDDDFPSLKIVVAFLMFNPGFSKNVKRIFSKLITLDRIKADFTSNLQTLCCKTFYHRKLLKVL